MTELVLGGGFGAVVGALAMGFFLFRESGKRKDAEAGLAVMTRQHATQKSLAVKLAEMTRQKEDRIRELEKKLHDRLSEAELVDELNSLFDSPGDGGDRGGKPPPSSGSPN